MTPTESASSAQVPKETQPEEYDLVILGDGTGSTLAAWTFASEGQRVAVVERKFIGGSCPNIACLPSKNIIDSAKIATYFRGEESGGIAKPGSAIDMLAVLARKRGMVRGLDEMYLDCHLLCEITQFDVRRILKEREFETYLGIQRPLISKRVKEIEQYVSTLDACFPTAVILSVPGVCATFDEKSSSLTLSNYIDTEDESRTVFYRQIAKVIDGQHRIEGLKNFKGDRFEVNVCIFVDLDVAEEGYIFSTVNLTQTKVNRSLVYDLFDLAKALSPQKLCHNIAVALDKNPKSPFHQKIKRLGVATEGRFSETLTQATFVGALIVYISKDPVLDRDLYMRGKHPVRVGAEESKTLIFRNMMIDGKEVEIGDIIWNYFDAIRERWPRAWSASGTGQILNRTNGFRAFMRFLRPAYLYLTAPGRVPSKKDFDTVCAKINFEDNRFSTHTYPPGTSGEVGLYRDLREASRI